MLKKQLNIALSVTTAKLSHNGNPYRFPYTNCGRHAPAMVSLHSTNCR